MSEKKTFGADMRITGLGLFTTSDGDDRQRRIELGSLETDHFEGVLGSFEYRADELSVDGLKTTLGRAQTTAESADLSSLEARSSDGNIAINAHRIGFPRGLLLTQREELFAPHASLEDARIVIHDLGQLSSRRRAAQADDDDPTGASEAASEAEKSASGEEPAADARPDSGSDAEPDEPEPTPERMNWRFLDVLEGQLDLDLVLDMTLPWVGRRRATHYFRIPIENGTINYAKLDADVHWLEAAFLAIERVDDKLVLTRDMPLVPYRRKAMLEIPLEPQDVPVAAYHRVHLRNLIRLRRPQRPAARSSDKGKSKSRLTLHTLDMENIKLQLHARAPAHIALPGGAIIQLGDDEQHGLVNLVMHGALRHHRDDSNEPTQLGGEIELIDLTVKDLSFRSATVSADRVHIGAVDKITIGFDGFRPRSLEVAASRLAITNLRLHFD